ncbi:MAG TPA: 4-hydroxy-tetrahydrodipicolinate synthase, partial [Euryarchaeota archaeon]|nr:4-hydroxy-tetrahydrodipicolinate synthase [Euryarchaeota archaeon]
PYIIPGRTGTMLLPPDLAMLSKSHPNVFAVKEATGDFENMRAIRKLCGPEFTIMSGDDDKTIEMMTDASIGAAGVISVVSNILPAAMWEMVTAQLRGDSKKASELLALLKPLIQVVTVKTEEKTPFGSATCRARNPLATKTLMNILGMPAGPCRQPLGKMTRTGIQMVVEAARKAYDARPELFSPVEKFFDVEVAERLSEGKYLEGLYYGSY